MEVEEMEAEAEAEAEAEEVLLANDGNNISTCVSPNYSKFNTRLTVHTKDNLFTDIHKRLRMFPGLYKFQGLNLLTPLEEASHSPDSAKPLEQVRNIADLIATDIVLNFSLSMFGSVNEDDASRRPLNKFCKTMRIMVAELATRHRTTIEGMVLKLKVTEDTAFRTFVSVVDEIFIDGMINWGRIVAVYAFAARLGKYCRDNHAMEKFPEKIALYAGKYVGSKLGQWILDNGDWETFANFFTDSASSGSDNNETMWKSLVFTAVGLGAIATAIAAR